MNSETGDVWLELPDGRWRLRGSDLIVDPSDPRVGSLVPVSEKVADQLQAGRAAEALARDLDRATRRFLEWKNR